MTATREARDDVPFASPSNATPSRAVYNGLRFGGVRRCEAWGVLADGRPFHFAARGDVWQVRVTSEPDGDPSDGVVVAHGPDRTGGVMWREEIVALLDAHLPRVLAEGRPAEGFAPPD